MMKNKKINAMKSYLCKKNNQLFFPLSENRDLTSNENYLLNKTLMASKYKLTCVYWTFSQESKDTVGKTSHKLFTSDPR